MTGGIVMIGAAALLVYLWVTGQLQALITLVTDAAKGKTQAPAGVLGQSGFGKGGAAGAGAGGGKGGSW